MTVTHDSAFSSVQPAKIVQQNGPMGMFRGTVTSVGREGVFTLGAHVG